MNAIPPAVEVSLSDTVTDRVRARIQNDILHGVYEPGSRLRIADLASRYGVSHLPIREALRQLEGTRVLRLHSHKGAVLRSIDARFIANMYDVRSALEVMLVEKCVEKIEPAQIRQLERLAADYERCAGADDRAATLEANRAFHCLIYRIADNPEAEQIISQGWELINALRMRFGFGQTRTRSVILEHRDLVRAIASGDKAAAVEAGRRHCASARDDLLDRWRSEQARP